MAAFGMCGLLAGCGQPDPPAATPTTPATVSPSMPVVPIPDAPGGPPLPPSNALTDVMGRLSDPAIPGAEKISLIEQGTPAEAAGLDRFAAALRDSGSLPMTFEARDLAWSQSAPGNVVAIIVARPADPQAPEFTYPMQFAPSAGSWQLTRQTADLLLQLDPAAAPPATPPR